MKRFLITALIISGFFSANAQDDDSAPPATLNYNMLKKKFEKSNEDIVNAKKNTKDKTWFSRGELLQDIHDVNIEYLRLGMPQSEVKIFKGEPTEVKTDADGRELHVYERIILAFENGTLVDWTETEQIHENPLPLALDAYFKAEELDVKGKLDKKLLVNLDRMKRQTETDAILDYGRQDFDKALEKFELIIRVSEVPVFEGAIDSVVIYNAALAARNAGMHEEAAKYFEWATNINYGGSDAYYLLMQEYITIKDSTKALSALQRGHEMYPDTAYLLLQLVNFYLNSGDLAEGLKYLELAEIKAPNNASIPFAKGTIYERQGEKEKAMQEYLKSIKIDPEFYNSWYNIGAMSYNAAVELYDEANTKTDVDEYNAAKAVADEALKLAIEPMLKAAEFCPPGDSAPFQTLKTIYYRLGETEKYEEMNKILEQLKQ